MVRFIDEEQMESWEGCRAEQDKKAARDDGGSFSYSHREGRGGRHRLQTAVFLEGSFLCAERQAAQLLA